MDTQKSRLAAAIEKWMEYYGWNPYQAANKCELHWNTMSRLLSDPDYQPTGPVREKIIKGFNFRRFEDVWSDPPSRANAPPGQGKPIDLSDLLDDPETNIDGTPLTEEQRNFLRYLIESFRKDQSAKS